MILTLNRDPFAPTFCIIHSKMLKQPSHFTHSNLSAQVGGGRDIKIQQEVKVSNNHFTAELKTEQQR